MKIFDHIKQAFIRNPAAWILFGMLMISLYGHYKTAKDLELICALTGPHDVSIPARFTHTARQKIDNICIRHESDDEPDGP